ncbi:MAG: DUF1566 domain-containing protein [Deltaproteobacteria bacterium]|nr:DUF1566 domain-containing protein [Deltaproteobacteria bacterium]
MLIRMCLLTAAIALLPAGCGGDDDSGDCDPLAEVSHADSAVVWLQCPVGACFDGAACVGEPQTVVWQDALDGCPAGFRLPTREEFRELLECEEGSSTCDPCGLSVPCANMFRPDAEYICESDIDRSYYSSTEVDDASDRVYAGQFEIGEVSMSEKDQLRPIRCVR